MTDIYLNCNSSNIRFAESIKKEVESRSQLRVKVQNDDDDDEHDDEQDFYDCVDMASRMIIINTSPETTITAWVIDHNFRRGSCCCCKPQKVDLKNPSGMQTLLYYLVQETTTGRKMKRTLFSSAWKRTKNTTAGILLLFWQVWIMIAK